MKSLILTSTLTCPDCGNKWQENMPQDSCIFFGECPYCHLLLKPLKGDCCIYCSYGSHPCPPIQENRSCCN
ncbi:MAG: hypothetical protein B7Z60_02020 [Ferrovum sp. 37-45-19]|uniref:GDCCVxC domain-containing (seleno)protein n=1 Tax=Ferrovum sp. JA12 TaxID=1356299 RepID=UPI0009EC6C8E|nr:GDCCVxC domain-containing (seleno)protein [Ferrovum sp. JA12]OYV79428.1 MAG: hypothetical protein B7Z65_06240 [Ferrovum sp. 21-44-67]OYV94993.1 MAG: hypothetical protein B7Z60_02020 [Ferrovum sp. 37-45-19]OZB34237.1 MAG: hypothetical protein B7X47_01310 [Ferrovum sp. 34-44-207]HQT80952.1 GDCCVxC domain-containing (seleno)protein [Ferrovaceae bacterium]HQU06954.1 GDCCVxC domain-containing (seleno)protein [Ferrovaceae bacterium]